MAQAMLSVRIDEADKRNFEEFCNNVGMNVSVAVNMFVKNVLREQQLPFTVKAGPFYSSANMAQIKKANEHIASGRVITKTMAELEAMEIE